MRRASRVSVIVPTFNRAALLPRALESLLAQTRRADEIIVVDDGSTDGTAAVLERFGDAIRYIREAENRGISHARNTGMRAATGDYLAFLDSDDAYAPRKLELQAAFLDAHPEIAMVSTDISAHYRNGKVRERHLRLYHENYELKGWSYEDIYEEKGEFAAPGGAVPYYAGNIFRYIIEGPLLASPTVMLRREVVDTVGYQNERFRWAEDYEFGARICKRFRVGFLDIPTYTVHYHDEQISGFMARADSDDADDLRWTIEGWLNALEMVRGLAYEDGEFYAAHKALVDSTLARLHWRLAVLRLRFGDSRGARADIRAARGFSGRNLRYLEGWLLSYVPLPLRRGVLRARA